MLLILVLAACQKQIVPVKSRAFYQTNVGGAPNDGTGTPIRQAFIWNNLNWLAQQDTNGFDRDSLLNKPTHVQLDNKLINLYDTTLAAATNMETYVDSRLASFEGTAGAIGIYELKGIVGTTTGFPADGDSLIINDSLKVHSHPIVTRDGNRIWQNTSNINAPDGYTFDQVSGTIIFKPILAAGTQIFVDAYDPMIFHDLIPQGGGGGGGGSGASSLLTGLIGSWSLDETTGTTLVDNLGLHNATNSGAVLNQNGEFNRSALFDTQTDYVQIEDAVALHPDTAMTVSLWFNLNSLPASGGGKNYFLFRHTTNDAYVFSYGILIDQSDNHIAFYVYNTTGGFFTQETDAGLLSTSTWYNLICNVHVGASPRIYLNNVLRDHYATGGNFSGSIMVPNRQLFIGSPSQYGTSAIMGYMDEVNFLNRTTTAAERLLLQTKYWPFN